MKKKQDDWMQKILFDVDEIKSESIKLELNFHGVISTIFELIDVEVLISTK